jgi:hypothetical protein
VAAESGGRQREVLASKVTALPFLILELESSYKICWNSKIQTIKRTSGLATIHQINRLYRAIIWSKINLTP